MAVCQPTSLLMINRHREQARFYRSDAELVEQGVQLFAEFF